MSRTLLNVSLVTILSVAAASPGQARAESPDSAAAKPAVAAKPLFGVYTSGGCSRSLRQVGTFDNAGKAFQSAAELRTTHKHVFVATGELTSWPRDLLPQFRGENENLKCSIYTVACRVGWRVHSTIAGSKMADAVAESLQSEFQPVEIVFHLGK